MFRFVTMLKKAKAGAKISPPIVRVQGNFRGVSNSALNFPTFALAPTAGNVLILTICARNNPARTVVSIVQAGVTWILVIEQLNTPTYFYTGIWIGIVGAGASDTATITFSGTCISVSDACEYSGIVTVGYLDKTASNSGSGNPTDTGTTAITTQPKELWVGVTHSFAVTQSNPTNGFTLMDGALYSNTSNAYLEKIVSTVGPANSGTTILGNNWAGLIATFRGL